jgi:hypothetical protein
MQKVSEQNTNKKCAVHYLNTCQNISSEVLVQKLSIQQYLSLIITYQTVAKIKDLRNNVSKKLRKLGTAFPGFKSLGRKNYKNATTN